MKAGIVVAYIAAAKLSVDVEIPHGHLTCRFVESSV